MTVRLSNFVALALVILLAVTPAMAAHHEKNGEMNGKGDVVDVASGMDQFSTLVAAVKAAGLVETLKGDGPFTVFAPTNNAFDKLPAGTVDSLLEAGNREKLRAVLTYHVVPGRITAADAMQASSAETVQGQSLSITTEGERVMIDNATVVKADVPASNGVIHVIDTVLMPQ